MRRITDENGRCGHMGPLMAWERARAKAEREALPFEIVARVAREEAQRRLSQQKLTSKPRVCIHAFRNDKGHWYSITAGKWHIRCKSWYRLVFRAAYGPWNRNPPDYTERTLPSQRHHGGVEELSNRKNDETFERFIGYPPRKGLR